MATKRFNISTFQKPFRGDSCTWVKVEDTKYSNVFSEPVTFAKMRIEVARGIVRYLKKLQERFNQQYYDTAKKEE